MATLTGTLQGVLRGPLRRPHTSVGIWGWITTVDHKRIGILYGVTALIFFLSGGTMALIMRTQLALPEQTIVGPDTFNALFTMHGTIMVFLVIMPLSAAFFNFLIPLMIGARDVAFPRLNALSYWLFLFGGLFLHVSFLAGGSPDAGWFSYANLTEKPFSANHGLDFWVLGLQILGVASMMSAFNFIVTIINMRAKGMSFLRMPIFIWMTMVVAFLLIFAFPIITVALFLLMFDRQFGTSFFLARGGGDPLLWQHLFWLFGHPEVYILILPAMGIVSEILPVFSRKPLFGYTSIVLAGIFIGVMGFAVWSHHMFAVGLGPIPNGYFATATMLIGIPTGVKIFNWLATIYGGKLSFKTPMLFALAFIALFTIGGISGVMHASPPTDLQQTDTYFIVAHFHYVLFGGSIFGLMGGIYYWFPKVTGRMYNEGLGKLHFWLMFIGSNMTFFPMHWLGLEGMPRRVYTYDSALGLGWLNLLITVGAFIMAASFVIMAFNLIKSAKYGEKAPADPWDGHTLEWSIPSPPPIYNFAKLPVVRSNRPFWDEKYPETAEHPVPANGNGNGHGNGRKVHTVIHMPSPSYWPIIFAAGLVTAAFGVVYIHVGIAGKSLVAAGLAVVIGSIYAWVREPVMAEDGHH